MKAELKEKKEIIYFDEATYNRFNKLQQELKQTFKELKDLHLQVLETEVIEDYKEFLDNATDYLVSRWFGLNNHLYPYGTEQRKAFRILDVEISDIDYLNTRFKNLCKQMREYQPVISISGIKYQVRKQKFEYVLDENKREHYEALKEYVAAANKLQEFEPLQKGFLIKSSHNLRPNGIEVEIITPNFIN